MHDQQKIKIISRELQIPDEQAEQLLEQYNFDHNKAIRSYGSPKLDISLPPDWKPYGPGRQLKHCLRKQGDVDATMTAGKPPSSASTISTSKSSKKPSNNCDLVLPRVRAPNVPINNKISDVLLLQDLVGAIQNGETLEQVRSYLSVHDAQEIRKHINHDVKGFPAIFYVVETRDSDLLRLWWKYGGNVNETATWRGLQNVPLLAYAVSIGTSFKQNTTLLVATLLSIGAVHSSIPKAFYTPYDRDLPRNGPDDGELPELSEKRMSWCTEPVRRMLAARLNLEQRYYLNLASLLLQPRIRARQISKFKSAENLFSVPFFLIGQTVASQFLIKRLLHHLAKPSKQPLVLVFAGPSGHGKTELARKLGELMGLEMEVVDCTNKDHDRDMFGARNPWQGWEMGSPLNNFLARKDATKSMVFLDEFEKTTTEIHQTLLPFQSGEYENRRTRGRPVDCSQTIWILATNTFDSTIHQTCKEHKALLFCDANISAKQKVLKDLCKELRNESIGKFGAPLTGRITDFIPFVTFSAGEQAVVAHRNLALLGQELAKPIVISDDEDKQRFVGDIDLQVSKDYSVCRIIAKDGYVEQLGARSLISGVKRLVEGEVLDLYLDKDAELKEGQDIATYRVEVNEDDEIEVCHVQKNSGRLAWSD